MARDSQRAKVYKWESTVFADQWKEPSLTPRAALGLIRKVLTDVGRNPDLVRVKFTKRKGGACASRLSMNFTPTRLPAILVIHELAHTLTYGTNGASGDLRRNCTQGHGPRYVACYLALIERYMGLDIRPALQTLRWGFEVVERKRVPTGEIVKVPVYIYRAGKTEVRGFEDRPATAVVERKKLVSPPKYDRAALEIWRAEFEGRKI